MLAKRHETAITRAKTEAEKVTAAARAMIETPMDLIRHILQRHEESVIEVMRELSVKNEALRKDAEFYQDQAQLSASASKKAAKDKLFDVGTAQFLTDVLTAAGLLYHGKTDKDLAQRLSDGQARLRDKLHAL